MDRVRPIAVLGAILAACSDGKSGAAGPDRDDVGVLRDSGDRADLEDTRLEVRPSDTFEESDADVLVDDSTDTAEEGLDAEIHDADTSDERTTSDIEGDTAGDAAADVAGDLSPDGPQGCVWKDSTLGDQDRPVLISHPFSDTIGVSGTEVHLLTLTRAGALVDELVRLDVGFRPSRIEFLPSGDLALVIGERGELASVLVGEDLALLDTVALPSGDYGDILTAPSLGLAYLVGLNVAETGGISTVEIGCDGSLNVVEEVFLNIRLAESIVDLGDGRALLVGGQTVFEPLDPNDIRLLRREGAGLVETGGFDIFGDIVSTGRIGISPERDRVMIPNNSIASSEASLVLVVAVEGDSVREVQRLTGLDDPSEVVFSPDGTTAVVSLVEPGRVVVFRRDADGTFTETQRVAGIGLPDQIAAIESGPLAGTMLVPSIDPSGVSNIAMLRFTGPGVVEDLGQFDLGEDFSDIPEAIAIPE